MKQIIPAYYGRFRCLAEACPDNCCRLWEIQVDSQTQALYDSAEDPRLRAALTQAPEGDTVLTQIDGSCSLLDEDGLCAAQKALGPQAVCQICREYPRMTQDYGDFVELDLELSCPEAARLILTRQATPPEVRSIPGGSSPDYDLKLMSLLLQSRRTALEFLDDPDRSLGEALAILLLYACEIQAQLDGAEPLPFSPEAALQTARSLARPGDLDALFSFYVSLEILTPTWHDLLCQPPTQQDWSPALRAFARYELNRYWLHAVSDFDLVPRVKMILAACVLLRHLDGEQTIYLYSREIDDDADNIDAILDGAYTQPALTDDRLLGLLLH